MIARLATCLDRDDNGAAAVVVALVVVFVVLPVAAVSVDLSNAYANRRHMQNAADAAAQAGAQVMAMGQATGTIDAAVRSIATANGVNTSDPAFSCQVVHVSYSGGIATVDRAAPCTSWAAGQGYNAVRVNTANNVQTFFAPALGLLDGSSGTASTRAVATATAAIQKVVMSGADAIFAMCANAQGNDDPTYNLLNAAGQLVTTAPQVGHSYLVWSNAGGNSGLNRCGLKSSAWDGIICGVVPANGSNTCIQPITLPNWLWVGPGAQVGPTLMTMAGYSACKPSDLTVSHPTFSPCAAAIPVCDSSNQATGQNGQVHCVAWGEFLLYPDPGGSAKIWGTYRGPANPAQAPPADCPPAPASCDAGAGDPYRVALVQ